MLIITINLRKKTYVTDSALDLATSGKLVVDVPAWKYTQEPSVGVGSTKTGWASHGILEENT